MPPPMVTHVSILRFDSLAKYCMTAFVSVVPSTRTVDKLRTGVFGSSQYGVIGLQGKTQTIRCSVAISRVNTLRLYLLRRDSGDDEDHSLTD